MYKLILGVRNIFLLFQVLILEDVCQDYVCQLMHFVSIERDRYQGTPRHNRTCPRCDSGEVEDEKHFLFNCNSLILQQNELLSCIDANCAQLKTFDNKNKLIWLMNSENKDVLLELCNFSKNNEKHT